MGKDVELIKHLLAEGFQITSKSYAIKKKDESSNSLDLMTITVLLKKGEEQKEIKSSEDSEIFGFLNHFVFMQDEHDNSVAVYVDDPSAYEPDSKTISMPLDEKHVVFIGSRKFEEGVSVHHITPNPKKPLDVSCAFRIRKDKSPEIENVDYKDYVRIMEKSKGTVVFAGFINHAINQHGSITFRCLDGTKNSRFQKLTTETHIENIPDQLYFVSQTAGGMKIKFAPDFLEKINLTEREFLIIMPINNIFLRENITVNDVEIYHKFDSNEDYIIRKSKTGREDSDWNGNKLRIRTTVSATDFYSAIMRGKEKISQVIDWIALRSDFSFTGYEKDGKYKEVYFSMYRHMSRIKSPEKIFCKEKHGRDYLLFDLKSILENQLVFEHEANSFFDATKELVVPILSKTEDSRTQTEHALLNGLHWLRLGIFSENSVERLMFLYNALEFAVSEINLPKIFSKEEVKSIRKKIISDSVSDIKKRKIEFAISQLNNHSLNETISDFCKKENIPMTKEEWAIIKKCREKRNDIIHGKSNIIIHYEETDKLQTLIERIILKRLSLI